MRLLLDEMIAPRIARELRKRDYDVQAIQGDRPELASRADREIVAQMTVESRVIVTNNVIDFVAIHDRVLAEDGSHAGMIFTFDETLPRSRAAIPQWVDNLAMLLDEYADDQALRRRVLHLV